MSHFVLVAMAPSFDCAVSSLLCAEDNLFDDNDFGSLRVQVESEEVSRNHQRNHNQNRGFDHDDEEDGLPLQSSDEYLTSVIEKESHHLPRMDYLKRLQSGDLDLGARNEAVDWIRKVGFFYFWYDLMVVESSISFIHELYHRSEKVSIFALLLESKKFEGTLQKNLKSYVLVF